MSCFVTTDYTVLAIVEGMRRHEFISKGKRDAADMAEALRAVNECMVSMRYGGGEQVTMDSITANEHCPVEAEPRDFETGEILAACRCWLYQCDNGEPMDFDTLTIFMAVQKLVKAIVEKGKEDGTIKVRCYFGTYHYLVDDGYGDFVDIYDLYGWDLEAQPKAA